MTQGVVGPCCGLARGEAICPDGRSPLEGQVAWKNRKSTHGRKPLATGGEDSPDPCRNRLQAVGSARPRLVRYDFFW